MTASIEHLPAELFSKIFESLDVDDRDDWESLSHLRLSSRRLSVLASPAVFKTVPFCLSLQSLENLTNISEHITL